MARARLLKPSFFTNDALGEIEPLGRLLFAGLWCLADRDGRLHDRPKRIKAEVLPYDDVDVDRLLTVLEERSFIVRYTVDGERYLVSMLGERVNWVANVRANDHSATLRHGAVETVRLEAPRTT